MYVRAIRFPLSAGVFLFGVLPVVLVATLALGEDPRPSNPLLEGLGGADEDPGQFGDLADDLDANKDGVISDAEARAAADRIGKKANAPQKNAEDQKLLDAFDGNRDGKLDREEAEAAIARRRALADRVGRQVAEVFDLMDADNDQFVTQAEYLQSLRKLGELGKLIGPKIGEALQKADVNRDGKVSFTESQMIADAFAAHTLQKAEQRDAERELQLQQAVAGVLAGLDGNRDGAISLREARRNPQVAARFGEVDSDKNGELTPEELYNYLSEHLPRPSEIKRQAHEVKKRMRE